MTWTSDLPPPQGGIGPKAWPRLMWRAGAFFVVIFVGLVLKLLLRGIERALFGLRRPLTPFITQVVCRVALKIVQLPLHVQGRPMRQRGAIVANHASWLDIFVLNAADRVFFVSKHEVAGWPGIGLLARVTGTVFIRRDRRDATRQKLLFEARLRAGHRLLFFPEGTSSDGRRILPFKSTLFAAFFAPEMRDILYIQPVSVTYHPPAGTDPRFYGWWGDMDFAGHLMRILAQRHQGCVELVFHTPIAVVDMPDRKAMTLACEAAVRAGFRTHV
jgi:1-acyl-sn-glycerol-3-phosphate acyltransferase